jgi:hypothetical protein
MAKRKKSPRSPQPRSRKNRQGSQFDRRSRLNRANTERQRTRRARVPLTGMVAKVVESMSRFLDSRIAGRLSIIMSGMMLASQRRVAASWFAAGGVCDDWDRFYACLYSVGRRVRSLGVPVLVAVLRRFDPGPHGHLTVAVDDSPTRRYGQKVEGAGVHHHPTPGPADSEWLFGHNWVSLCLLARRGPWGVVALPLQSLLYVRKADMTRLAAKYGWKFRTKLELAVDLVTWFVKQVRAMGWQCGIRLVVDGAYAARPLLAPLIKQGVVVFSRLRRDAAIYDLPPTSRPGKRGPKCIYGKQRLHLAKRAGQNKGWTQLTYVSRGAEVTRDCKSFLATSKITGGAIRVVIVRFADRNWAAYFSTDPDLSAREIMETISARWAIEEHFHDVKEVWGDDQQQVRNVWSNIACWHLNQWCYALVELATWDADPSSLVDRSDRPWDNPARRPSHADRRRAISREMLRKTYLAALPDEPEPRQFRNAIESLIAMCA